MKIYYRLRQIIFAGFSGLVNNKKPNLINKRGGLLDLVEELINKQYKNIFIVTTPGMIKRETLVPFLSKLDENNIKYSLFSNVSPDPTVENVLDGEKAYREAKSDSIVAIGGGSVIDCAKVIAARIANPKREVEKLQGLLKIKGKIPPFYPVPTTCGTGSEITAGAVITKHTEYSDYKITIVDLKLVADLAILDGSLLDTLPKNMLATTTMDALTHALEVYFNKYGSKRVLNKSMEAIKLIKENFNNAYLNNDKASIDNLLYASYLAGDAISHNYVGYVHAIAHAIGGIYHLPHGYLNSIILPYVLEAYGKSLDKKLKKLDEYLGENHNVNNLDTLIAEIEEMKKLANLPNKIEELKESDFDEIIKRALKEANPQYPVPKILFKEELKSILNKLLK